MQAVRVAVWGDADDFTSHLAALRGEGGHETDDTAAALAAFGLKEATT
jgi:hypothetical protein